MLVIDKFTKIDNILNFNFELKLILFNNDLDEVSKKVIKNLKFSNVNFKNLVAERSNM